MKLKHLGAITASIFLMTACSQEEEDRTVQYFTGVNPAWFRSAPSPSTLENAQELEMNVFNAQTSAAKGVNNSFTFIENKLPLFINILNLSKKLEDARSELVSSSQILHLDCKVSGTKDIDIKKDLENTYFTSLNVSFNLCKEEATTIDGEMEVLHLGNGFSVESKTINFLTDFSLQTNQGISVLEKGSEFSYENVENNSNLIHLHQTYIMQKNDKVFGAQDLVYMFEKYEGFLSYYPVSGREYILNGSSYFEVDNAYDASLTPFIIRDKTLESGGLFKYLGEKGNKLEIEVINSNEVTIKADANGDGSFDFNNETKIKL